MDAQEYIEKAHELCKLNYDEQWHCIGCPAYSRKRSLCILKHDNEVSADEKINLLLLCEQKGLL